MKKIVLLLALFGLAFQTTSCKSKKAQDDTEIVEKGKEFFEFELKTLKL